MISSLHPHHHHVIDVTTEEELESCSGGHSAITRKTSANKNKVGMTVHVVLKHQLGYTVLKMLCQSSDKTCLSESAETEKIRVLHNFLVTKYSDVTGSERQR